jgi:predicted transcriptional regulator
MDKAKLFKMALASKGMTYRSFAELHDINNSNLTKVACGYKSYPRIELLIQKEIEAFKKTIKKTMG